MRILLIEDDTVLGAAVRDQIAASGHSVDWVTRLDAAGDAMAGAAYDLMLLDLMLPDGRGIAFLRSLRANGDVTPVIVLTALDQISDRIEGLNAGADDYLVKPFAFSELLARVQALLRRSGGRRDDDGSRLHLADLELDPRRRRAYRSGRQITLTAQEYSLLALLLQRQGEVLSRNELAEQLWGVSFDSDTNVVEVAIRRLRLKLEHPSEEKLLHTIRGMGYVLERREN